MALRRAETCAHPSSAPVLAPPAQGRTHLGSVTLDESSVDGVGHGERTHVGSELIAFDLVRGESGGGLEGLERVDLHEGRLVRDDRDELVVRKLDLRS